MRRLKEAVESSWTTSPTTPPTECCEIANSPKRLEYDSRFRNKVDFARLCVKVSESAPSYRQHVADSVLSEMKDIMRQYSVIKWQYFASEEGMLANFPAFEDKEDCRSYDPRFRPFYVETATPEPKDVVLVIDTSGSMHGDRIVVAKAAAKTVLSTMNPRDRVSKVIHDCKLFKQHLKFCVHCFWAWLTDWLTDQPTDWVTGWLTYWFSDWPIDEVTDWPTDRLTDWPTDQPTDQRSDWPTDKLTNWLSEWVSGWLNDWPTDLLINWPAIDRPTDWLTHKNLKHCNKVVN